MLKSFLVSYLAYIGKIFSSKNPIKILLRLILWTSPTLSTHVLIVLYLYTASKHKMQRGKQCWLLAVGSFAKLKRSSKRFVPPVDVCSSGLNKLDIVGPVVASAQHRVVLIKPTKVTRLTIPIIESILKYFEGNNRPQLNYITKVGNPHHSLHSGSSKNVGCWREFCDCLINEEDQAGNFLISIAVLRLPSTENYFDKKILFLSILRRRF